MDHDFFSFFLFYYANWIKGNEWCTNSICFILFPRTTKEIEFFFIFLGLAKIQAKTKLWRKQWVHGFYDFIDCRRPRNYFLPLLQRCQLMGLQIPCNVFSACLFSMTFGPHISSHPIIKFLSLFTVNKRAIFSPSLMAINLHFSIVWLLHWIHFVGDDTALSENRDILRNAFRLNGEHWTQQQETTIIIIVITVKDK